MAKKLAYCIDNQLIEQELVVISKLLQVQDYELTEICIDSLRSFDNETGHSFIKSNPQIIHMIKSRMKSAGNVERVLLENFIAVFEKN